MAAIFILAAQVLKRRLVRKRESRATATSSSVLDDKSTFRLQNNERGLLVYEYLQHRRINQPIARYTVTEIKIKTFLLYLSSGGYYRQCARSQGLSESTVLQYMNEVAEYICSTVVIHINLPDQATLNNIPNRQLNEHRVISLVDGFILNIQRPNGAGDAFYCGRPGKSFDSLNIQYVADLSGNIIHIITGVPGRTHDRNALEWSFRFRAWSDNLPHNFCVLGDSAYVRYHPSSYYYSQSTEG